MSWQGVPFKLLEAGNVDQLLLKLSSLPKLTIDTPTDYNQLALTVGATFLGGIIPALIAWRTFHVNAKNVKKERQEQQKFLQAERAKQHIFMMGERSSQFSSLKEDRELQTSIAQKTINAQVVSSNRQNWINELRLKVAEFCAAYFVMFSAHSDYLIQLHAFKQINECTKDYLGHPDARATAASAQEKLTTALDKSRAEQINVEKLKYNIFLMLNNEEVDSLQMIATINDMMVVVFSLETDQNGNFVNYDEGYSSAKDNASLLINQTRVLLKKEWCRVKSGT